MGARKTAAMRSVIALGLLLCVAGEFCVAKPVLRCCPNKYPGNENSHALGSSLAGHKGSLCL
jgi:hypothetical protein